MNADVRAKECAMEDEEIETLMISIEDSGAMQSADELRGLLEGTEYLQDSHPRIGWYWGFLTCLEISELIPA